jgi:pyruvate ferredoxin oxidoreductase gamma subunit
MVLWARDLWVYFTVRGVRQPGLMFEVRLHGRGGQGVVTASDLLALAAFEEGGHAQSFPSFGSERTGAPVVAYCRLSDRDIRTREPVVTASW